jgi:hypothetical protein
MVAGALKYPQLFMIRGNIGQINIFISIDISSLTNDVFNAQILLQGNNLGKYLPFLIL